MTINGGMEMQSFILKNFMGKDVTVYCGGILTFRGNVKACNDGVLTLEITNQRYSHISVGKIITVQPNENTDNA
ncbi:MM0924 family protein [uncultured Methanolobus sp.]|uniref:MM0924 family protein n=1 Tax=uncultured Methanolobus sp. TaxID=218300 RepID=UPI0029C859CF|nr:MM0924 family protein [uncultured Methanolobus sp.]